MTEEPLSDIWRQDFIRQLEARISTAQKAVDSAKEKGWYREQCQIAVDMYKSALNAVEDRETTL